MSDTTTCSYCGCTLTMGRYEFTGHTDELCKALTLDRIRFAERALEDAKRDLTILRDMMGRHVCAPAAGEREEKRTVCSAPGCTHDPSLVCLRCRDFDVTTVPAPAPDAVRTVAAEADLARLRAAATYALAVLTRLADSAASWADYDVPVGIVAEIDEAKARLAGVLGE